MKKKIKGPALLLLPILLLVGVGDAAQIIEPLLCSDSSAGRVHANQATCFFLFILLQSLFLSFFDSP